MGVSRTTTREVFGNNLKRMRARAGLRQKDVAKLCGCAQSYISSLEGGDFAPSISTLERLAAALGVSPAELLMADEDASGPGSVAEGIAIVNDKSPLELPSPRIEGNKAVGDSSRVFCAPGLRPSDAFAAYLPDDSMAPSFERGDLIVLSLTRKPADGDACLVDMGKGHVFFRTVLSLGGGRWRLQPANAEFAPEVIRATRGVRMWPAIGRWQVLPYRRRG